MIDKQSFVLVDRVAAGVNVCRACPKNEGDMRNEEEWTAAKRICKEAKQQVLLALESEVEDEIAFRERKAWKHFDKKNVRR